MHESEQNETAVSTLFTPFEGSIQNCTAVIVDILSLHQHSLAKLVQKCKCPRLEGKFLPKNYKTEVLLYMVISEWGLWQRTASDCLQCGLKSMPFLGLFC